MYRKALEDGVTQATWPSPLCVQLILDRQIMHSKKKSMSWFVSFTHKELEIALPLVVFLVRSSTDVFKKEKNLLRAAVIGVVWYLLSVLELCSCSVV